MAAGDVRLPTADTNCGMTSLGASRLSREMMVVLDRAISIDPDRWNSFLSAVATAIAQNDTVDWGLYAFPTNGAACSMASLGTTVDVMPAPDQAIHVVSHLIAAGAVTGGSPTAAAIDVAASYMLSRTTPAAKFLLLVTDGAPTCAGRSGALGADPTGAQADAVAAIAEAKEAGLPTLVLAPSTTSNADDIAALNALAVAGGYARTGDVMFETEATIASPFQTAQPTNTCVVILGPSPPVPDVVTVTFNGAVVPRDRSHTLGWDYTSPSATAIALYGAWCDMTRTAPSWQLEVYYGCPN